MWVCVKGKSQSIELDLIYVGKGRQSTGYTKSTGAIEHAVSYVAVLTLLVRSWVCGQVIQQLQKYTKRHKY